MDVELHQGAAAELGELRRRSVREYTAMLRAITKLETFGAGLGYPHTSQVRNAPVRELRPRGGRSPWRAFYRQEGDVLRIGALGPEAEHDSQGFHAAVDRAVSRLESP